MLKAHINTGKNQSYGILRGQNGKRLVFVKISDKRSKVCNVTKITVILDSLSKFQRLEYLYKYEKIYNYQSTIEYYS